MMRALFSKVALGGLLFAAACLPVSAAIETDPQALHAMMQQAYDEGTAHGWSFADETYYQSAVFATGRAYSLFDHDNPNYPSVAAITLDIAAALHYDPLLNNDASEWWVREAAVYIAAHDLQRAAAAQVLLARLDRFDSGSQSAAQIADDDAVQNIASFHGDAWARVDRVIADLRAYRYSGDEKYARLALQEAAQSSFPLIHLPDVASEALYDYAQTIKMNVQSDPLAHANAIEVLRRRDATPLLQEIGHVTAVSHRFHLSITAPADEYFGPTKMSVLGIHNAIHDIDAHLRVGWGSQLAQKGVDLATALDELHRVYPRDFELPRLLASAAEVIMRIPSPEAQAGATSLRRILLVEYPDSVQARALLTPPSASSHE